MWRLAILIFFAMTAAVHAGPWPRAEGTTFTAMGMNGDPAVSFYGEHGIGNDWTVGIETYGNWQFHGHAALFASKSFALEGGSRMALDFGMETGSEGLVLVDPMTMAYGLDLTGPAVRLGASWGRGLDLLEGGWLTVGGSQRLGDIPVTKLEVTMGVSPTGWSKVYGQLQGSFVQGEAIWRVEAVAGVKLSDNQDFLISANAPLGAGNTRLGILLWQTF